MEAATPAIARGFHSATCNPATIRRYWTDPDRNIGIPTGASSHIWVLDVDGEQRLIPWPDLTTGRVQVEFNRPSEPEEG